MLLKSLRLNNTFAIVLMFGLLFALLFFFSGSSHLPRLSTPLGLSLSSAAAARNPFTDLAGAFREWDSKVGCDRFRERLKLSPIPASNGSSSSSASLQEGDGESRCGELRMGHVSVLVKGWTWIPDNLDNLYSCSCGLTCLWTKSPVLADKPDALLFETTTPPVRRRTGDPLRAYMDLEPGRKRSGTEDLFISYHAEDDVQSTYAGGLFHNGRNYHVSPYKNNDTLIYWSSSRCLPERNRLAKKLLGLLPHHSFGRCLNNVGGPNMALSMYPKCAIDPLAAPKWWDHLHCAMSHYKFVLAVENTATESYVTEKLFYALDSGSVPVYFGAANVWDFVPPHSIIDGSKFGSVEEVAAHVRAVADDPVAYAEYHAWRRCGVLGNYGKTRSVSLDTLPCRLCRAISRRGGRNAKAM